jgi:hypothetical protein
MARKSVEMSAIRLDVQRVNTAPEFHVADGDKVFGDLRVSQGGAFWRPRNAQQYHYLTWEKLDELFRQHGPLRPVGEYNFKSPPPASFEEF